MNDPISITKSELKSLIDSKADFVLLDVREPAEHVMSSIPGDVLIPLSELKQRAEKELNPEKQTIVYCAHGVRSLNAAGYLKSIGFKNVRSLTGGIAQYFQH